MILILKIYYLIKSYRRDDYDPDFISEDEKHTPDDIIKLKYVMFNGTSVVLI